METAFDRYLYCNTLVGILKACEGRHLQVDLRNESHLIGTVDYVSPNMNITMSNTFLIRSLSNRQMPGNSQTRTFYREMTLRGNNVRFVHVPDEINMTEALRRQIKEVKNRTKAKFSGQKRRFVSSRPVVRKEEAI